MASVTGRIGWEPSNLQAIISNLTDKLKGLPQSWEGQLEATTKAFDLAGWLFDQRIYPKFFWSNRGLWQVAGLGALLFFSSDKDAHEALSRAQKFVAGHNQTAPGLKFFGGTDFFPQQLTDRPPAWPEFGRGYFFVPILEIEQTGDECRFRLNLLTDEARDKATALLQTLGTETNPPEAGNSRIANWSNSPELPDWTKAIETALAAFDSDPLEKVVLARKTSSGHSGSLRADQLLDPKDSTFSFALQVTEEAPVFVGNSPERLFHRKQNNLYTESLAGTQPAEAAPDPAELFHAKEHREHFYVTEFIRDKMKELCTAFEMAPPSQIRFEQLVHLIQKFKGKLKAGQGDMDIISNLHPTPAVGGYPQQNALPVIMQEPFRRGWYGGPIGWFSVNESECAVAIRSALLHKDTIDLFAGAGIVDGSNPQAEWDELEQKILKLRDRIDKLI